MNTYYDIFKISHSATQAEIKSAYHELALKYHPDRNLDKELGDSKMKEINFIYSILSNPEKRKWYDSTTTFNSDYRETEEYSYSNIFCDEIDVVDSKGTKTKLKVLYLLQDKKTKPKLKPLSRCIPHFHCRPSTSIHQFESSR